MNDDKRDLVQWKTIDHLVVVWEQATDRIRAGAAAFAEAEQALVTAFMPSGRSFDVDSTVRYHKATVTKPDEIINEFSKVVWRCLVERLQIKQLCSPRRADELEKALDAGKLGPVTRDNLTTVLAGFVQNIGDFMQEAVVDLFDRLRPRKSWRGLKTNDPERNDYVIGRKVILHCAVGGYGRNWDASCSYRRSDDLRAMDNVFHLLDGKGPVKEHYGPLITAINALHKTETVTETDYFRVKCYHNNNLHIEFKRLDLLAELNRRGGGANLKPGKEETYEAVA